MCQFTYLSSSGCPPHQLKMSTLPNKLTLPGLSILVSLFPEWTVPSFKKVLSIDRHYNILKMNLLDAGLMSGPICRAGQRTYSPQSDRFLCCFTSSGTVGKKLNSPPIFFSMSATEKIHCDLSFSS